MTNSTSQSTLRMRYSRGDIVWVRFPFTDLTAAKKRPALIISNNEINRTGDYLMMMITSKIKGDNLSIKISDSDYLETPLGLNSLVRVHKITLIEEFLIIRKDTSIREEFLDLILTKLISLITQDQVNTIL